MASRSSTPPRVTARTQGWAGGINIRDAVNQLQANEARLLQNMLLDERGGAIKRLGCSSHGTFGSGGDRVLSAYTFYRVDFPPQVLIHTTAGKLYVTEDAADDVLDLAFTWTEIATGLDTAAPMSYETFLGNVYMGNGVDDYSSWDGFSITTFASAPKGKFHRIWKDTMWISGVTGQEDRVYSSAAGDAETFPAPNFVDIAKGDGDIMSALATDGQFLIIGKRNRTFTIYDPVTFANRVVDFEKGFESHFAVVQLEGDTFFLSRRGICRYLGDSPSVIISGKLDPLFSDELLAIDKLYLATGYIAQSRVGFTFYEPTGTYPTLSIEYYPRLAQDGPGPWAFQRMPAACFTSVRYGAHERLFASHNNSNKFLHLFDPEAGTDDGTNFRGTLETGATPLTDPDRTKYISRLRFLISGAFNCYILRDFGSALYRTIPIDGSEDQLFWDDAGTWGDGYWGVSPELTEIRKNTDAYGRYFTFRFSDPDLAEVGNRLIPVGATLRVVPAGEWAIYGMVIEAKELGVRS